MPNFDITPYVHIAPSEERKLVREGVLRMPTAGICAGYAQANLVLLPGEHAEEFREFARLNPGPCPLLEVLRGSPKTKLIAKDGDVTTDVPEYFVYRDGVFSERVNDASGFWSDGWVGFLIGCSFSFEEALMKAGIEVRHIAQKRNVPMFKVDIQTKPAGPFRGKMVCSMRPMTPENAKRAAEITAAMPNVHGAPVQIGHPEDIGVYDLMKPDYGEAVDIHPGEIPVFWPCGVTPQSALEAAKLPLVVTHSPGYMFITDVLNAELNGFLEAHRSEIE